jgi:hypothetical protein
MDELRPTPKLSNPEQVEQSLERWFAGLRISLILAWMSIVSGDRGMLAESFASQYLSKVLAERS